MSRLDWPHQTEAADAIIRAFESGAPRLPGPAAVIATGGGKTGVLGLVKRRLVGRGERMLTIVHRTEIIDQLVAEYRRALPGMAVGIVRARENDALAPVVVGSVATLASEARRRMLGDVALIAVDECHHATAATYRAIIEHWPNARLVGVTATMTRADEAALGALWRVVYTKGIAALIAEGRLVRPRGLRVRVADLDLAGLRTRGKAGAGDITEGDVGRAISESHAPEAIAKALLEHASNRPTIVFAPTVASAMVVADAIRDAGLSVDVVHGSMPAETRKRVLDDYRGRRTQVLVNCMVLTEGTDLPLTSCIVVARPTQSRGLYVQMVGRGLRLDNDAGKTDCLILDIVGVTKRFGLATPIDLFGDEPAKAREVADLDDENAAELDELLAPDDEDEPAGRVLELLGDPEPAGPLVFQEVDLFKASPYDWRSTRLGVPFLAGTDRYICVVASLAPGLYDVLEVDKHKVGVSRYVMPRAHRSQYSAMSAAEALLTFKESRDARTKGSYGGRKAASANQVGVLRRMGMHVGTDITRGEASELFDVFYATKRIDGRLAEHMKEGLSK